MLLLEDIFKQLIVETISRNKILDAIKNLNVVSLYYSDPSDEVLNGYRRVEIWCYGRNKSGNDVIRVWLLPEDKKRLGFWRLSVSKSYPPGKPDDVLTWKPAWRLMRTDRIRNMMKTGEKITQTRPKFNPQDKDMVQIYSCIKI